MRWFGHVLSVEGPREEPGHPGGTMSLPGLRTPWDTPWGEGSLGFPA